MVKRKFKGIILMLIIKKYRKNHKYFWEYKIRFYDVFTGKIKTRRRGSFLTREDAMAAAYDLAEVMRLPIKDIITRD